MSKDVVAAVEAADYLGLSLQRVHQLIAAESLPARALTNRQYVVDRDVLEEFAARRRLPHTRAFSQPVAWPLRHSPTGTGRCRGLTPPNGHG